MEEQARRIGRIQSILTISGPLLLLLAALLKKSQQSDALFAQFDAAVLAAAILMTTAGFLWLKSSVLAISMVVSSLAIFAERHWALFSQSPQLALLGLIASITVLGLCFSPHTYSQHPFRLKLVVTERRLRAGLRTASWGMLLIWITLLAIGRGEQFFGHSALNSAAVVLLFWSISWASIERRRKSFHPIWVGLGSVFLLSTLAAGWQYGFEYTSASLLFPVAVLFLTHRRHKNPVGSTWVDMALEHPARLLIFTFLLLCLAGTLVLSVSKVSATGESIALIDAAFTAVSAVCVTGLIVLDTPTDFTFFGQAIILILIQIGGLGIMTFYTAAFSLLGRRLSIKQERAFAATLGREHKSSLLTAIKRILVVTVISEVIGATLLVWSFCKSGDAFSDALWRGVFTAISAFCNAGFALQSTSLVPYQSDPFILNIIATLIILGGLSPAVVLALPRLFQSKKVNLQIRLVLWSSLLLLVGGTVCVAAFEWNNTLAEMSFIDRISNAWFQSVTTRTAGFNSVDISAFHPATLVVCLILMWIGGSPGGTAGGIKTTTCALLFLAIVATFRGQKKVAILGRTVPHEGIYRSAAVLSASFVLAALALITLFLTQDIAPGKLVFEAISALGTVGLSTGATGQLDQIGKFIIIVCMFIGRVGPLTVFLFLSSASTAQREWKFPEEEVAVG